MKVNKHAKCDGVTDINEHYQVMNMTNMIYSKTYNQSIGIQKIIFFYIQRIRSSHTAPAVPDQPIKASTTYRLARNNLR